jgi:AcrR family transcriptional regulator
MADEIEVPPAIALAWGVAERPSRGPRPTLALHTVIEAAVDIAANEGLAGVSMARVARKVGVSTMALYRYVPSKRDLLELMVDAALGPPPRLPEDTAWRAGLRGWAEGVRDRYRTHPWALKVPISGPPMGPNNVRWLEYGLTTLRGTPLGDPQKLSCVLMVSAYVRGTEAITSEILSHVAATGRGPDDYGVVLSRLIDPAHFPEIHRAIGAGALRDDDAEDIGMDDEFAFGIERILDGVAALIDAAAAGIPD